jgi:D-threo-aldose 1-dehydrogenase
VALGHSRVTTTDLVFGGAPIGGLFAPVSDEQALATLDAAWAAGIRAYDTAPHYGVGLSEERLSRLLSRVPRAEVTLSTKVGRLLVPAQGTVEGVEGFHGTPARARVRDYSREGVLRSLDASLARLGTDHVDVVLVHDPDEHWEEAVSLAFPALAQLRAENVIGAIGVGMNQTAMLTRFVLETDVDVVLVAGRYTLLDTSAGSDLLPACVQRGVSVLAGGVFNSGVLAAAGPAATYDYAAAGAEILHRVARLGDVCARHGVPLRVVAQQFALAHPAVAAVVVGLRSPQEVEAAVQAAGAVVPDDVWRDLASEGLLPGDVPTPGSA